MESYLYELMSACDERDKKQKKQKRAWALACERHQEENIEW